MNNQSNPVIKKDILRYKKNKPAANLALAGLACGCAYFLVLYAQVKNNDFYYNWSIAVDVIYNLFFMLFVFLFSEQVKNYNRKLFPLQLIVGILQIARTFWLPLTGYLKQAITLGSFLAMSIFLVASGVLIITSAVIGYIRSRTVETFIRQLEEGSVDLDAELKKEDAFAVHAEGGRTNA